MTEVLGGLARWVLDVCFMAFHVQSRADDAMVDAGPVVGRKSKAAWRGAVAVGRLQWHAAWLLIAGALVAFGVWSFFYWLRSG
jgi:hypothetical protein